MYLIIIGTDCWYREGMILDDELIGSDD